MQVASMMDHWWGTFDARLVADREERADAQAPCSPSTSNFSPLHEDWQ